jgi:hypothetical protein
MDDFLAAVGQAPLWAQLGMALFALMVVVMLVEPRVRQRSHRRRFDALAEALGARPPEGRGWPVSFGTTAGGRAFTVEHDFIGTGRGASYRGPRGFLITTTTGLSGDRWSMHQADVEKLHGWLATIGRSRHATGDEAFDRRFMAVVDGPRRPGAARPSRASGGTRGGARAHRGIPRVQPSGVTAARTEAAGCGRAPGGKHR